MVNITFKNVGQGDSIILEWCVEKSKKLAIIDCNLTDSETNPVLNHIVENEIKEIEFLFLSHPHKDHYSGFFSLIAYCVENNINIKRFIHTASVSIDYLIAASRSVTEQKELAKLYKTIMRMRDSGQLMMHTVDDNPDTIVPLSYGFKLEFLAPSSLEIENYIKGVNFPFDEENSTSHPNGNWFSSIIKISNDNTCVLLTSDVESKVLRRLNKRNGRLKKQKSILVQVPHHGSKKNLNTSFWTGLSKYPKTYSVISVGKNGYKHPSNEVVNFFTNHPDYVLKRTDYVPKISNLAKINSKMLDIVSKKMLSTGHEKQSLSQDLRFELTDKSCKLLN